MKDSQEDARRGKEPGRTDLAGSFPGWLWRLASKSGEDGEGWQAASPAGCGGLPLRMARMVKDGRQLPRLVVEELPEGHPAGITSGWAKTERIAQNNYIYIIRCINIFICKNMFSK